MQKHVQLQIEVETIKDSLTAFNIRGTTLRLRYPRFIHSEFMTHRVFTRNASSSRAVPVEKTIEQVMNDPAIPARWGREGKGMQDHGELLEVDQDYCEEKWLEARDHAVMVCQDLIRMPERPHKQVVNRLLEPWQYINVLVTSTEWGNFVALRDHEAADPTMAILGGMVHEELMQSKPRILEHGDWHMPFIDQETVEDCATGATDFEQITQRCLMVSAARSARVSYNNFDGKRSTLDKDLELYEKLLLEAPLHASPAEHQFTPDVFIDGKWGQPDLHGNLTGVIQLRKTIPNECVYEDFHIPYNERMNPDG